MLFLRLIFHDGWMDDVPTPNEMENVQVEIPKQSYGCSEIKRNQFKEHNDTM